MRQHQEDGRRGEWSGVWQEDEYRDIMDVYSSFLVGGCLGLMV